MSISDDEILAGRVVLIIEDDAMQLMAMQMLLENWGCTVVPTGSAQAAIDSVVAGQRPDLVISDFRLPHNLSGIEAMARLREMLGNDLPAVLQTGDTDPALVREAQAQGYLMLHKPYDPNSLRGLMATLLSR